MENWPGRAVQPYSRHTFLVYEDVETHANFNIGTFHKTHRTTSLVIESRMSITQFENLLDRLCGIAYFYYQYHYHYHFHDHYHYYY